MIPALSLRHNGALPRIVESSLPSWALECSNWRERVAKLSLRSAEIALKSIGVTGALVLSTLVAVAAMCLVLMGINMLIGYDFNKNIFSFLWEYHSQGWGWRYGSDGRILAGYFGLLLGAIVVYMSPYLLWGLPLASAVGIFHWLDRPFRQRRIEKGTWSVPLVLVEDLASLGEIFSKFSDRLPLGSPRVRSGLAKAARSSAIVLTVAAYFLVVIVLKDLTLAVPFVWILLLIFGLHIVAMGLIGLVVGFVLNCIVPATFAHHLLDGVGPIRALRQAFRSALGDRR